MNFDEKVVEPKASFIKFRLLDNQFISHGDTNWGVSNNEAHEKCYTKTQHFNMSDFTWKEDHFSNIEHRGFSHGQRLIKISIQMPNFRPDA